VACVYDRNSANHDRSQARATGNAAIQRLTINAGPVVANDRSGLAANSRDTGPSSARFMFIAPAIA
jgi:hypothetical protein